MPPSSWLRPLIPALPALLLAAALLGAGGAVAQAPKLPPSPALPAAGAADPGGGAAGDARKADLAALIAALEDPATREALVGQLKTLSGGEQPAKPPAAETLPGAVDRLGDEVAQRVTSTTTSVLGLVDSIEAVPTLVDWLRQQFADPVYRSVWYSVVSQSGLALVLGFLGSLLLRASLRRWRDVASELPERPALRAKAVASSRYLAVDLGAVAVFLAITYTALQLLDVTWLARRIADQVLLAVAICRSVTALAKALLARRRPRQRLVPLDDGRAARLQGWIVVVAGLSVYGYFGLVAAQQLGLPWTAYTFLLHFLFAVVTALIVVFVLRLRQPLARSVEEWGASSRSLVAGYVPWPALAATGPLALVAYVLAQYLVWALAVPGGTALLTRGALVTAAVLFAVRILFVRLDRAQAATGQDSALVAELEEPAGVSTASITLLALRAAALLLGAAVIFQAWGLDLVAWSRTDYGRVIVTALLRLAVMAGVALLVVHAINVLARRYLEARDEHGNLRYSNRSRTLAIISRNLALVAVGFVALINGLAELGVDATALFAGAGVLGLAIGFGSQKLVQDLITGLFILLGDTIRVGDVVNLGGRGGAVEAMSMRTIALRDYDGAVHTIPYSSIDVVTNMTKDFSFCVLEVPVAMREDVDRVLGVLRDLDSQLRREWPYRRLMLEPIDIAGLDRFSDAAQLVKARIKTRAGDQWKVGYEMKRRMKKRFDELGIEIPFAHRTLLLADDDKSRPGAAAARLREDILRREGRENDAVARA